MLVEQRNTNQPAEKSRPAREPTNQLTAHVKRAHACIPTSETEAYPMAQSKPTATKLIMLLVFFILLGVPVRLLFPVLMSRAKGGITMKQNVGAPLQLSALTCQAPLTSLGDKKFFIYDDHAIRMSDFLQGIASQTLSEGWVALTPDMLLFNLFDLHPRRTLDPAKASFFIIPIPFQYQVVVDHANGQDGKHVPEVQAAFAALLNHSVFTSHEGRHHFLPLHDWRIAGNREAEYIKQFRQHLRFVTIGGMEHKNHHSSEWPSSVARLKITIPFGTIKQSTSLSETLLAKGGKVPPPLFASSSFQEWQARPYRIFYHTRDRSSSNGATPLRQFFDSKHSWGHAPPASFTWNTSIGYAIASEVFEQHIQLSQFCLVIRGDSPTSHSFSRALGAGCIPIIISDPFEEVGMPFFPYLSLENFAFQIQENDFLKDPWGHLHRLLAAHTVDKVPTATIVAKYEFMENCARKALLYNHPQTLVPDYILLGIQDSRFESWGYVLNETGW
eukprot:gb/GEZN01006783.1/.p1 GENE.gb/GEZN01006783.1/~~gb/GEZN01006783.1/.p1  ORF type:complete len:501 (-),score=49.95 gb/GEZN01006783.1/:92-1594(-)